VTSPTPDGAVARLNAWHAFVVDVIAVLVLGSLAWHGAIPAAAVTAIIGGLVGLRGAAASRSGGVPPSGVILPLAWAAAHRRAGGA
jgi:hypothetical protein